jgi:molybdopterin-guanine dinucleotide biosynthesis protein A
MGQDKGLIDSKSEAKAWAEIVRDKFYTISIPSFLSINQSQTENYLLHFNEDDLIVDNPSLKVQGPLLGLFSVHLKYPDQDLIVVACDMINIDSVALMKLVSSYNSSHPDAIAFKGERIEPLCAIYSSQGLTKIYSAHQEKKLYKNSMMHALEELNAEYISIPEKWNSFFKNFNNAEDLNGKS